MTAALTVAPPLSIAAGAAPLPREVAGKVALVLVRGVLGAPAVAEIDFAEPPDTAEALLAVGQDLKLDVGGAALFEGRIAMAEWEYRGDGGRLLRVRAYDALEALRQRCRIRRLEAMSAARLAEELAAEVGLTARVDGPCRDVPVALQGGRSDLEFLSELAARDGLYPVVDDGVLRLLTLDGDDGDGTRLSLGRNLHEARLAVSAERSLASVDVEAWSAATLEAQRASRTRDAQAGARADVIADRIVGTAAASEALGDAALARAQASERSATGVCRGDAALKPGRPITIDGTAASVAGRYVLTSVLHRFDASGYRAEFSTRPPPPPPQRVGPVVTIGRVVSIDDPEKRGRCRIALPGFGGVEAGWLQCVAAGAGRRKGVAVLPESGEDVLAVFTDGDLGHGFVIGGLYGSRSLPPGLRGSGGRPFVIRTGAGQSLELSGSGSVARLSTRAGSLLEFTHDGARLAAAGDLVIEAPGRRIVIRADAVDFERG